MTQTIEGVFREGKIELSQQPTLAGESRVVVTFLGPTDDRDSDVGPNEPSLAQRFAKLVHDWKHDCAAKSSIQDKVMHPAYQQIIGMGQSVLPLILGEMQAQPDHWSWALRAISGENPVNPDHRGQLPLMARDWLDWAQAKGYAVTKHGSD